MASPKRMVNRLKKRERRSVKTGESPYEERWLQAVPELEKIALKARERAHSWKGFHVGIGALLHLPDGTFNLASGANHKAASGPRQPGDHCAEEDIDVAMHDMRCDEAVGMVVVAPPQQDDHSGFDLGVTINCGHCRKRFDEHLKKGGPIKPHTRMVFINAENPQKRIELTVESILRLCGRGVSKKRSRKK